MKAQERMMISEAYTEANCIITDFQEVATEMVRLKERIGRFRMRMMFEVDRAKSKEPWVNIMSLIDGPEENVDRIVKAILFPMAANQEEVIEPAQQPLE